MMKTTPRLRKQAGVMDNLRKQADMPNRTCTVAECERPHLAKQMCSAHYRRAKRGAPLTDPIRGSASDICIVEDCGRDSQHFGWCFTHHKRWQTTGVVGGPIEGRQKNGGGCAIEACDRGSSERGWCWSHYQQWYARGTVADRPIWPNGWRGDEISYSGMHMRLKRERGYAADLGCVSCGLAARHWSYSNSDPNDRIDEITGLRYSTDMDHYDPRCVSCHSLYDRGQLSAVEAYESEFEDAS